MSLEAKRGKAIEEATTAERDKRRSNFLKYSISYVDQVFSLYIRVTKKICSLCSIRGNHTKTPVENAHSFRNRPLNTRDNSGSLLALFYILLPMNPLPTLILVISFLCPALLFSEGDGDSSNPVDPFAAPLQKEERETFPELCKIVLTLHKGEKLISRFIAYASPDIYDGYVEANGALSFSRKKWLADIRWDLSKHEDSTVYVTIDDLAYARIDSENKMRRIEIFSATQKSRGLGSYLFGEVEGITIRASIKAVDTEPEKEDKGKQ